MTFRQLQGLPRGLLEASVGATRTRLRSRRGGARRLPPAGTAAAPPGEACEAAGPGPGGRAFTAEAALLGRRRAAPARHAALSRALAVLGRAILGRAGCASAAAALLRAAAAAFRRGRTLGRRLERRHRAACGPAGLGLLRAARRVQRDGHAVWAKQGSGSSGFANWLVRGRDTRRGAAAHRASAPAATAARPAAGRRPARAALRRRAPRRAPRHAPRAPGAASRAPRPPARRPAAAGGRGGARTAAAARRGAPARARAARASAALW